MKMNLNVLSNLILCGVVSFDIRVIWSFVCYFIIFLCFCLIVAFSRFKFCVIQVVHFLLWKKNVLIILKQIITVSFFFYFFSYLNFQLLQFIVFFPSKSTEIFFILLRWNLYYFLIVSALHRVTKINFELISHITCVILTHVFLIISSMLRSCIAQTKLVKRMVCCFRTQELVMVENMKK